MGGCWVACGAYGGSFEHLEGGVVGGREGGSGG